jgi:alanine racemase
MSSINHALANLTIDLDAVAANYHLLRARHPFGAVSAVVKADGYGLGAVQVSARLYREGCRHFFVATLDEALELQPYVPTALIACLTGVAPNAARQQAASGCVPVINSLPELALWRAEAHRLGRSLPVFLHIDTGMNRLGLAPEEIDRLAQNPGLLSGIELRTILTHLVAAELPDDPINKIQIERFTTACARLPRALRSIANSSGLFLGPEFASDLARPGAALYGVNPTPQMPNPMHPVVSLSARVLQLREVPEGETVGYNGIWEAQVPSIIATIGAGYADGLLRSLSNQGQAFFDGAPLPLVGRVSMDLITFDATNIPAICPGDQLELLGPHQGVDALARAAGTSGYEILTSLGARYHRTWLGA